jgi:hypothetical protein
LPILWSSTRGKPQAAIGKAAAPFKHFPARARLLTHTPVPGRWTGGSLFATLTTPVVTALYDPGYRDFWAGRRKKGGEAEKILPKTVFFLYGITIAFNVSLEKHR